jgi:hypothetical protein
MIEGLLAQIPSDTDKISLADAFNEVALAPLQFLSGRGTAFTIRDDRASTLEPLEESRQQGSGRDPHQGVNVSSHDPELEDVCLLLPGDISKEAAQEAGEPGIDQGLTISGRPNDVAIDPIVHRAKVVLTPQASGIISPQQEPL